MTGIYRSFAHRVDIGAPVERVWRAFTDPTLLPRWCAEQASISAREKGRLHIHWSDGAEYDAHVDVFMPPQRLRLILMPTPSMPPPPQDSAVVEDFLFERGSSGTSVRLLSTGIPSRQSWVTYYLSQRRHWELALARLKVFLEKGLDQQQPSARY